MLQISYIINGAKLGGATGAMARNCKNLPPLLQIHRHDQFLKTKPSSQDNLHFINEL